MAVAIGLGIAAVVMAMVYGLSGEVYDGGPIAWGAHLDPEFKNALIAMAIRNKWNPSHLTAIMHKESGISATIQNPVTMATGLIQFLRTTAQHLGTTVEALHQMTRTEQLPYVEKYFHQFNLGEWPSLLDLYSAVFWPAAIGKPNSYVLFSDGLTPEERAINQQVKEGKLPKTSFIPYKNHAYAANVHSDRNGDGVVDKGESIGDVVNHLKDGLKPGNIG